MIYLSSQRNKKGVIINKDYVVFNVHDNKSAEVTASLLAKAIIINYEMTHENDEKDEESWG